jgi:Tfp pilus assembly PilM family ATPase
VFFGSNFSYGLEVTEHEFRWVGLHRKDLSYHCFRCSLFGDREGKEHEQDSESYQRALKQAVETCKKNAPKWSKTVCSTVSSGCLGGFLELPSLTDKELEIAVPGAVCRKLPWNLEDIYLTVQKVEPLSGQGDVVGICYLAVQKQALIEQKSLLMKLGLKPSSIDLLPLALIREFETNHGAQDGPIGLVHLSDRHTHILFLKGSHPYFYRSFGPGYADFVYAVQMDGQMSWADAARKLSKLDLSEGVLGLEPCLLRWLREVGRCTKAVEALGQGSPLKPTQFFVSGEGLPGGLDVRLQDQTGVSSRCDGVGFIHPIDTSTRDQNPAFKVALGLALG